VSDLDLDHIEKITMKNWWEKLLLKLKNFLSKNQVNLEIWYLLDKLNNKLPIIMNYQMIVSMMYMMLLWLSGLDTIISIQIWLILEEKEVNLLT
jgi:hypothetical protein